VVPAKEKQALFSAVLGCELLGWLAGFVHDEKETSGGLGNKYSFAGKAKALNHTA
jgi:hypothetical protein